MVVYNESELESLKRLNQITVDIKLSKAVARHALWIIKDQYPELIQELYAETKKKRV